MTYVITATQNNEPVFLRAEPVTVDGETEIKLVVVTTQLEASVFDTRAQVLRLIAAHAELDALNLEGLPVIKGDVESNEVTVYEDGFDAATSFRTPDNRSVWNLDPTIGYGTAPASIGNEQNTVSFLKELYELTKKYDLVIDGGQIVKFEDFDNDEAYPISDFSYTTDNYGDLTFEVLASD